MDAVAVARSWRAREQHAREEREAHATRLRATVETIVAGLLPPAGKAWLVGSLAWGEFGERSDIDLVLEGIDGAQVTAIELALVEATGVATDVLIAADLPPPFRDRVEREGIAIHGR